MTQTLPTVAKLKADIARHRTYWPSNPLDTACEAVDALERLATARPDEVFGLLAELRGEATR